ncbi:MAG: endonuclease/exonuclease/phosphatase family protein [Chlorobiaceae bacterium]
MWWNTENLFDTANDPLTDDDDFTPAGKLHWTEKKLTLKQMRIRHILMAVEAHPDYKKVPDILAFAEVENRNVFQQTLNGIQGVHYKTIYYESPDPRGIDIGLAYNPRYVTLSFSKAYSVHLADKPTRKIIVAKFAVAGHLFHLILNHWPSRSFDTQWSEPKRLMAAKVTRHILDSLYLSNPLSAIITMGDFNDEPNNRSLKEILSSSFDISKVRSQRSTILYNCWSNYRGIGSYYYHNKWQRIDQILLSRGMLDNRGFSISNDAFRCFSISRMLDYSGKKPWPTYEKGEYKGGYSDHLPLLLKISITK